MQTGHATFRNNYKILMDEVSRYSHSKDWELARAEWEISNYSTFEDDEGTTCICSQPGCRYVYTIINKINNNSLYPIGSSCMKYFEFNEQQVYRKKIFEKWHNKKFKNPGKKYDGVEFNQVVKDTAYIDFIRKFGKKKEYQRLIEYADMCNNKPKIIKKLDTGAFYWDSDS